MFNMSTITIEQRKQIILIISYIILIHFKIKVSCVCSKLPSPVAVFFKSLHLHWQICHKSIKSNKLIDAFKDTFFRYKVITLKTW